MGRASALSFLMEPFMNTDYRPRLSIEISREDQEKLKKLIPYGMQKVVFTCVIRDLIEILEKYGSGTVIGAFIERDISLKDLLRLEFKGEKQDDSDS